VEIIEFRNMYNLHWNKVLILALSLLFLATAAMGQARPKGNYNYWEFRNKPFYFGLTIGMHSTGFIPSKSRQFSTSDSLSYAAGVSKPGLNLNIITNLKIGEHFDFRFIPGFAYSERRFDFNNPSAPETERKSHPTISSLKWVVVFNSFYLSSFSHLRLSTAKV